jgi:hypothetical protein
MTKCDYCPDNAKFIHNTEILCNRHLLALYDIKKTESKKIKVHKTQLEEKLFHKYNKLIQGEITQELIENFKIDAGRIRAYNK